MQSRVVLPAPLATALGTGGDGAARNTADAIDALEPTQILTRSRTTETAVVVLPGIPRAIRKRWWWPRRRDRAKGVFRTTFAATSPARREYDALLRLRSLPGGPFAPAPIGYVETRTAGVLIACALLLDEVPGAIDLARWLRDERDARLRRDVLLDLARRTRSMHDAGIVDREMHPRNVLVEPGAVRTWKIDVPKQRAGRGPASRAGAVDDLACLDVGLFRLASPEERAAFIAEYVGASVGGDTLSAFAAEIESRRAVQDLREAGRLPPLPSDTDR